MNFTVKGKVTQVMNEEVLNPDFKKKSFLLEVTEKKDDKEYTTPFHFEVYNDKISLLDGLNVGDEKTVHFNIRSREFESDGVKKYFTILNAWRLED